jgi:uncharacterized protein YdeI (YjbR/CyaY-like superfamily)
MKIVYFRSPAEFRIWLERHHADGSELQVGYWKKATGKPSLTWSESVDEALCFGWIDGVRRSVDEERFTIRFTPRKPTSTWSAINIAKFEKLESEGRMTEPGRAAFAKRRENRSGIYSYEQRPEALPTELRKLLDRSKSAARDFDGRSASYRRAAIWWVVSAKTEATRLRRLALLIDCHARGETLRQFRRRPGKGSPSSKKTKN